MMDIKTTNRATTLAFIACPFNRFSAKWFPSVRIGFILPAIPFSVFTPMNTIFTPPTCRTRMTAKEMFRMKIGRRTVEQVSAPIAWLCNSIASAWILSAYFSNFGALSGTIFLCSFIGLILFITNAAYFCNLFISHNKTIIHLYGVVKIEEKYCVIAKQRIENERKQRKLFT